MSKIENADEVERLRRAALEFRSRLRKRSLSVDSIWNAAVYECMSMFGPACGLGHRSEECQKCWIHNKLRGALRLENASYVPLKERITKSLERMRKTCTLKGAAYDSYVQALEDVAREVNEFMEDSE